MKTHKFRPCPFCGSKEVKILTSRYHWCECTSCGAEAPAGQTVKKAVAVWNKRVQ